ncbi:PE domain-containing protein [Actinosynnema sp. NPDC047251]|uniref:Uncharacterized protein n=1 Tax=Saccharothrix espanaensis (strain ATCC 51144 / DSM 44229 / JCM 9112 / NBRC 15066 / NRRL 15764) TaxID=1179773 RepID=K0K7X0_SACES|nr:PE domain-containing protein [Saccharothrix espanaensis]CCH33602.1 hypothetical protein BN6_63580 [Saccharothrix espanaensis DSM 44229]
MSGFRVDPDELAGFANRLADTGDDLRAALSGLAEPVGDLGPEGVSEAVSGLFAEWADTVRGLDFGVLADEVRATGETYRRADELDHG